MEGNCSNEKCYIIYLTVIITVIIEIIVKKIGILLNKDNNN